MNMLDRLDKNKLPSSILVTCHKVEKIHDEILEDIKLLLCQSNSKCDGCSSCLILEGQSIHPDFVNLDPLSFNVTVDDIRELVSFSRFKPSISPIKIVLIDNVDKLNLSSSNALLKTLEEPVDYQHFILTTNNEHDILPTILSRCVKIILPRDTTAYDFRDKNIISGIEKMIEGLVSKDPIATKNSLDYLKGKEINLILDSLHYFMYELINDNKDHKKNILDNLGLGRAFDIASWSLNMRKSSNSTKFNEELFFDQLLQKLSGD